jgi:diguanylate cyclase (GGDEF)-like protein
VRRVRNLPWRLIALGLLAYMSLTNFAGAATPSAHGPVTGGDGGLWLGDGDGLLRAESPTASARRIPDIGPIEGLWPSERGVLALDTRQLWAIDANAREVIAVGDERPLQLLPAQLQCRCWWLLGKRGLHLLQALGDRWSMAPIDLGDAPPPLRLLADAEGRLWLHSRAGIDSYATAQLLTGTAADSRQTWWSAPAAAIITSAASASSVAGANAPASGSTEGAFRSFWLGFALSALLAALLGTTLHRRQQQRLRALDARGSQEVDQLVLRRTAELEIANRTLRDLADTDALTGVANRRHFDHLLREGLERALLTGRPLSVLLLDVDHFKQFNDSHGHLAGDEALRQLGHLLQEAVRSDTAVARYGGEEFAIISPTRPSEALGLAERLRRHVEKNSEMRISIGVASFKPLNDHDESALLARADRALYAAKAAGRNCVRGAESAAVQAREPHPPLPQSAPAALDRSDR